jgi:hypothetical protein
MLRQWGDSSGCLSAAAQEDKSSSHTTARCRQVW